MRGKEALPDSAVLCILSLEALMRSGGASLVLGQLPAGDRPAASPLEEEQNRQGQLGAEHQPSLPDGVHLSHHGHDQILPRQKGHSADEFVIVTGLKILLTE
jgi:hypothetical protein